MRFRRFSRRGIAVALVASALAAAELALRIAQHLPNERGIQERIRTQATLADPPFVPDRELGAVMRPLTRISRSSPDFTYTLQTDHAGFPNLGPWPAQLDVAVLGNSLIAGTGVGNEGQFTTLLQQQLGTSKILNFGLHGGGTEQQLLIYRRFVAPLRPKIVVSALWPIYEIDNAIKFRHWQQDREHRDFIRNMAPDPAVDRHLDPRALVREAAEHFALVHALHQKSKELRGIQDPVQSVVVNNGKTLFLSSADQHWLELGCRRPGMPDACTALVEPLSQLKSEVEVNGGALLVVLVPSKEELYASDRLPDVLRTEREIRMALAKRKIPTLNLYPAFSTFARSRPEFYALDPHLNAFGHQLVSKALADAIQSRLGATQQGVIVSPRMSIGMRATSAKLVHTESASHR